MIPKCRGSARVRIALLAVAIGLWSCSSIDPRAVELNRKIFEAGTRLTHFGTQFGSDLAEAVAGQLDADELQRSYCGGPH